MKIQCKSLYDVKSFRVENSEFPFSDKKDI